MSRVGMSQESQLPQQNKKKKEKKKKKSLKSLADDSNPWSL